MSNHFLNSNLFYALTSTTIKYTHFNICQMASMSLEDKPNEDAQPQPTNPDGTPKLSKNQLKKLAKGKGKEKKEKQQWNQPGRFPGRSHKKYTWSNRCHSAWFGANRGPAHRIQ